MNRKIIHIDEEKYTGCGQCLPDCPEGALQLVEGKARLVKDLFCDGLGACIGTCPEEAITVIERKAGAYDEKAVMPTIVPQGLPDSFTHGTSAERVAWFKRGMESGEMVDRNCPELPAVG